jgi:hypothetical protein
VVDEVIQPGSVDHRVIMFGLSDPLQAGDEIRPYPMENYRPIPAATAIEDETWFFWIDDAPGAYFVHPNRFVFVPASGGEITVQEQEWWPELNGQGLWIASQEYWDPANWAWSNLPVFQSSQRPRGHGGPLAAPARTSTHQEGGNNWGVVINGWSPGETLGEEMASDAIAMRDLLTASGFSVNHLGPGGGQGPAGLSSGTFDALANIQQPGDTLIVFVTGHGWDDSGNGHSGPISESDLRAQLEKINPGVHIIVIVISCHSGTFRDGLQDVADMTITNTSNLDLAYSDADPEDGIEDPNPEDQGDEYFSGFREDWSEIMADPAQQEAARARASQQGTGFYEEVAALSHVSATEKDAMALAGLTFPGLTRGSPRTRPLVLQDASSDGVACGTTEVAQGLHPAADLGSVEVFTEGGQPGFLLTFPGVTSIASAVNALPPGEWAVSIRLLHPGLPAPEVDPANAWTSMTNEIYGIQFSQPAQSFQIRGASFTGQEWIGVPPLGSGVIPIGHTLKVILPARILDDRPTFSVDAFAEDVCDNVPADPTRERPRLIGEGESSERVFDVLFDMLANPVTDPSGDGLDCSTGAAVEGLPPEADITGLEVFTNGTTMLFVLRFPEGIDPAAAAVETSHPVRFGVSVLHPQVSLPTFDLNAVFATTQNIYHRIEFSSDAQNYAISIQELGPSNWLAAPSLGSGALAAGGTLQIALPHEGFPPGASFYVAAFLETDDGCFVDAVGYEDGAAALPVLPP